MPIQTELNRSSNSQNINYFDISRLYPSGIVIHIISAVYGILRNITKQMLIYFSVYMTL